MYFINTVQKREVRKKKRRTICRFWYTHLKHPKKLNLNPEMFNLNSNIFNSPKKTFHDEESVKPVHHQPGSSQRFPASGLRSPNALTHSLEEMLRLETHCTLQFPLHGSEVSPTTCSSGALPRLSVVEGHDATCNEHSSHFGQRMSKCFFHLTG